MSNDLNHAKAQKNERATDNTDRNPARERFERSLHLDIFNVGSTKDSLTNE